MADLLALLRDAGTHVLAGHLPPTPLLTALISKVRVVTRKLGVRKRLRP